MAVYNNRFVDVVIDSGGRAKPIEKVACHYHQYYSSHIAITLVTTAQ